MANLSLFLTHGSIKHSDAGLVIFFHIAFALQLQPTTDASQEASPGQIVSSSLRYTRLYKRAVVFSRFRLYLYSPRGHYGLKRETGQGLKDPRRRQRGEDSSE
jgi:hypothetical protein